MPKGPRKPVGRPRIHQTHEDVLAWRLLRQRKQYQRTSAENNSSIDELHDHNYSLPQSSNYMETLCNNYSNDSFRTHQTEEGIKHTDPSQVQHLPINYELHIKEENDEEQQDNYPPLQQLNNEIHIKEEILNDQYGIEHQQPQFETNLETRRAASECCSQRDKYEEQKQVQHLKLNHEILIKKELLNDQQQPYFETFAVRELVPQTEVDPTQQSKEIHIKEEILDDQEDNYLPQQHFVQNHIKVEHQEDVNQQFFMSDLGYEVEHSNSFTGLVEKSLEGNFFPQPQVEAVSVPTSMYESNHLPQSWEELIAKKRERNRRYQVAYRRRKKWNEEKLHAFPQQDQDTNDFPHIFFKKHPKTGKDLTPEEMLMRRARNRKYQTEYRQRQKIKEMQLKNMPSDNSNINLLIEN